MATLLMLLKALLGMLLGPPPKPIFRFSFGLQSTIHGLLDYFYWRGALDGLIVGVLIALLALPRIRRAAEGVGREAPGDSLD